MNIGCSAGSLNPGTAGAAKAFAGKNLRGIISPAALIIPAFRTCRRLFFHIFVSFFGVSGFDCPGAAYPGRLCLSHHSQEMCQIGQSGMVGYFKKSIKTLWQKKSLFRKAEKRIESCWVMQGSSASLANDCTSFQWDVRRNLSVVRRKKMITNCYRFASVCLIIDERT
jgi:hypothetical protein